jgi:hypothetical protein
VTLVRVDPNGNDGDDVVTGTPPGLTVTKSGTGIVKYDAAYGMSRGSAMGIRTEGPLAADQANILIVSNPSGGGLNGIGQIFFMLPAAWAPAGGSAHLAGLRVGLGGGNALRAFITTGLLLQFQNRLGAQIGSTVALTANTEYCLELESTPGTTTANGTGKGSLFDASQDVMNRVTHLINTQSFTAQNFAGDISSNVVSMRVGDATTAIVTNEKLGSTQHAIDVGASMPTIPFVDKNVLAGNFPLIAVNVGGVSSWV